mmetsp:Transcript_14064/g.34152  ORF Transcript_14064/g.34152 Transcript_14064/m.34152 type:complete len:233 (-) Transcript_14064:2-700(-)
MRATKRGIQPTDIIKIQSALGIGPLSRKKRPSNHRSRVHVRSLCVVLPENLRPHESPEIRRFVRPLRVHVPRVLAGKLFNPGDEGLVLGEIVESVEIVGDFLVVSGKRPSHPHVQLVHPERVLEGECPLLPEGEPVVVSSGVLLVVPSFKLWVVLQLHGQRSFEVLLVLYHRNIRQLPRQKRRLQPPAIPTRQIELLGNNRVDILHGRLNRHTGSGKRSQKSPLHGWCTNLA